MKKTMATALVMAVVMVSTASAETLHITDSFDLPNALDESTGMVEISNCDYYIERAFSTNDETVVRAELTTTPHLAAEPEIVEYGDHGGVLYTGASSMSSAIHYQHTSGVYYEFDKPLKSVAMSADYRIDRSVGGWLCFKLYGVNEDGSIWAKIINKPGWSEISWDGWHTYSMTDAESIVAAEGKEITAVYIFEADIPTLQQGSGYIDNISITAVEAESPVILNVEKEGNYTVSFTSGYGSLAAFVNGNEVTVEDGYIGYLYTGDELRILVDDEDAESVNQLDWQSWDLTYADGEISLHVEDPPICSDEELDAAFQQGADSVECSECIQDFDQEDIDTAYENGLNNAVCEQDFDQEDIDTAYENGKESVVCDEPTLQAAIAIQCSDDTMSKLSRHGRMLLKIKCNILMKLISRIDNIIAGSGNTSNHHSGRHHRHHRCNR